eukprot:3334551-Pyramimonas_sp.AAC.1
MRARPLVTGAGAVAGAPPARRAGTRSARGIARKVAGRGAEEKEKKRRRRRRRRESGESTTAPGRVAAAARVKGTRVMT